MAVDAYAALKELLAKLLGGDRALAAQYAEDPEGTLAAQGVTDGDLGDVDLYQLVGQCAAEAGTQVPGYGGAPPGQYPVASPPPAHPGSPATAEVVQHLNYITYAKYEGDEYITQQLINYQDYSTTIDNSTHVDVDGDFHGDIETTNVNAVGEGAMAAGENLAADGAQVIDGDNLGTALANSGDGAVQNVGQIDGPVSTGDGNVQAGRDIDAPVNTGEFTGIQGEHVDATNAVQNFGQGDVTHFGDADIDDSAVSLGGDATNVSDNELDEGSALNVGDGQASGYNYEHEEEVHIEAHDSQVSTEQGFGDQTAQQVNVDVDVNAADGHEDIPIM